MRLFLLVLTFGLNTFLLSGQEEYLSYQEIRQIANENNDFDAAISAAETTMSRMPTHELSMLLSRMYFWNKKFSEAMLSVNRHIKKYPNDIDAYILKGDILDSQSKFAESSIHFSTAAKKFQDNPTLFYRYAYAEKMLGNHQSSIGLLDSLLEKYPEFEKAKTLKKDLEYDSSLNTLSTSYISFTPLKRPNTSINFANFTYGRKHKKSTITLSLNNYLSERNYGSQGILGWYKSFNKEVYTHASIGYSRSKYFPNLRLNFSYFAERKSGYIYSLSTTYLQFPNEFATIFAPGFGKYIKNGLLQAKIFYVLGNEKMEYSFQANYRKYIKDGNFYIGVLAGSLPMETIMGVDEKPILVGPKYVGCEVRVPFFTKELHLTVNYNKNITQYSVGNDLFLINLMYHF